MALLPHCSEGTLLHVYLMLANVSYRIHDSSVLVQLTEAGKGLYTLIVTKDCIIYFNAYLPLILALCD